MLDSNSSGSDVEEVRAVCRTLLKGVPEDGNESNRKLGASGRCASPLPGHWIGGGERGDMRKEDRSALVDFLEELISNGGSNQSAETEESRPSLKRALEDEGSSSKPTSHVRQGVAREVARLITSFVGGGICRNCEKAGRFWESFFPCDVCTQHYCRECHRKKSLLCVECATCICIEDPFEFRCEACDDVLYHKHERCMKAYDQPLYCDGCIEDRSGESDVDSQALGDSQAEEGSGSEEEGSGSGEEDGESVASRMSSPRHRDWRTVASGTLDSKTEDRKALVELLDNLLICADINNNPKVESENMDTHSSQNSHEIDVISVSEHADSDIEKVEKVGPLRKLARLITLYVGGGLCSKCDRVNSFWNVYCACDECDQHYCKACYTQEPKVCASCKTCIDSNEEEPCEYNCTRCDIFLHNYMHAYCIDSLEYPLCDKCLDIVSDVDIEKDIVDLAKDSSSEEEEEQTARRKILKRKESSSEGEESSSEEEDSSSEKESSRKKTFRAEKTGLESSSEEEEEEEQENIPRNIPRRREHSMLKKKSISKNCSDMESSGSDERMGTSDEEECGFEKARHSRGSRLLKEANCDYDSEQGDDDMRESGGSDNQVTEKTGANKEEDSESEEMIGWWTVAEQENLKKNSKGMFGAEKVLSNKGENSGSEEITGCWSDVEEQNTHVEKECLHVDNVNLAQESSSANKEQSVGTLGAEKTQTGKDDSSSSDEMSTFRKKKSKTVPPKRAVFESESSSSDGEN